ncbi:uncharacterized [Tachysurus ichikawai]
MLLLQKAGQEGFEVGVAQQEWRFLGRQFVERSPSLQLEIPLRMQKCTTFQPVPNIVAVYLANIFEEFCETEGLLRELEID